MPDPATTTTLSGAPSVVSPKKPAKIDYKAETPVNARKRQTTQPITRQVTVQPDGNSPPVKLFDANPRRLESWIFNNGSVDIAIGGQDVTYAATTVKPGFIIPPRSSQFIDTTTASWYACANGGTGNDVRLMELLDDENMP